MLITMGVPGNYNFDIGRQVVKDFSVKHSVVNLKKTKLVYGGLFYACDTGEAWTPLTYFYYYHHTVKMLENESIYWSGDSGRTCWKPLL